MWITMHVCSDRNSNAHIPIYTNAHNPNVHRAPLLSVFIKAPQQILLPLIYISWVLYFFAGLFNMLSFISYGVYIAGFLGQKKKKKIQSLKSLELINSSRRAIANVYMLLSIGQAESWCNGIERDQKVPSSSIRRHLPHSTPCQATNQTHLSKLSCVELLAAASQQYLSKKSCEGFCLTFFFY